MSLHAPRALVRLPSSALARRLVPAAFVAQTVASLIVWFLVGDRFREGAWLNTDFGQWVALSTLFAAVVAVTCGVVMRRPLAAWAVVAGCVLAVISGCALFVGYAVFNSV